MYLNSYLLFLVFAPDLVRVNILRFLFQDSASDGHLQGQGRKQEIVNKAL